MALIIYSQLPFSANLKIHANQIDANLCLRFGYGQPQEAESHKTAM